MNNCAKQNTNFERIILEYLNDRIPLFLQSETKEINIEDLAKYVVNELQQYEELKKQFKLVMDTPYMSE